MKIIRYNNFLNEKLDFDDIKTRLGDEYSDLKNDLVNMINDSLKDNTETVNMIDIENFIGDYISSGKDAVMIDRLIEDNDVFNFYLKHQTEIDELLVNSKFMEKTPEENNVFGLYDILIDGTKQAILVTLKSINKKLFKNK